MKLVSAEEESAALSSLVLRYSDRVSSALAVVEVRRAVRRSAVGPEWEDRVDEILRSVPLVSVDMAILERASRLEPRQLRSLDAIHLATAMSLGNDLEALVTYDRKLAGAARQLKVSTLTPR